MGARQVLSAVGVAAALGLIGDKLLRAGPWGLNFTLWVGLLALATWWLTRGPDRRMTLGLVGWLGLATLFAGGVAWRDAPTLAAWNVLGSVLALGLAGLTRHRAPITETPLASTLRRLAWAALNGAAGAPILVLHDADWSNPPQFAGARRTARVALGVVLAIPVIVVFAKLLASADPVFQQLLESLVSWNIERLFGHLPLIALLTWLAAGYFRSLLTDPDIRLARDLRRLPLGAVELGIPLALLALLFLAFDVVQARYLFGGAQLVQQTVGLTYAEYARRGFFELVAVCVLVLPILLAADWALESRSERERRIVRGISVLLLLLVAVIVYSAGVRMRLYVEAYGLTSDRVYASAAMVWISASLAWFAATVLRGRRHRFTFGSLVGGFAVLAALNLVSPDALVARVNLARARAGIELDTEYLTRLGADAAATLLGALEGLGPDVACTILRGLQDRAADDWTGDWRTWSFARSRAVRSVRIAAEPRCDNPPQDAAPNRDPAESQLTPGGSKPPATL